MSPIVGKGSGSVTPPERSVPRTEQSPSGERFERIDGGRYDMGNQQITIRAVLTLVDVVFSRCTFCWYA